MSKVPLHYVCVSGSKVELSVASSPFYILVFSCYRHYRQQWRPLQFAVLCVYIHFAAAVAQDAGCSVYTVLTGSHAAA
jgi:hypothetical protein